MIESPRQTPWLMGEHRYGGGLPVLGLAVVAQTYLKRHDFSTKVLVASLKTVEEVMNLAGVDHITIAPQLLQELESQGFDPSSPTVFQSLFDRVLKESEIPAKFSFGDDQEAFRISMTREEQGLSEGKMIQVGQEERRRVLQGWLMRGDISRPSTYSVTRNCTWKQ